MSDRPSLARRLTTSMTIGLTILWLAAAITVAFVVHHETGEVFDSVLQETAQRLLPLAMADLVQRSENGKPRTLWHGGWASDQEEYLLYQVLSAEGRVLIRSHDAPEQPFQVKPKMGFETSGPWRIYTESSVDGKFYIHVAEQRKHRLEVIGEFIVWLLAPILVLVPLASIVVAVVVRRSLAPIQGVREAIGARNGGDLTPINDEGMTAELSPIVADVNRLLRRLDSALGAERSFAANSAHELRTPVAAALVQLDRLRMEVEGTPSVARVERITGVVRGLSNLVEKLLQLARAESGIAMNGELVDLATIAELLVDDFRSSERQEGRLRLTMETDDPIIVEVDMDAVAIALRNLIENALTHGIPEGTVELRVTVDRSIHVINDGPIIPPERLNTLMERFTRGSTEVEGSGLGLAIVATIVRQAGGALELRSPAIGRAAGFEAIMRFPVRIRN